MEKNPTEKHLFVVVGKSNCGKTTVVKKINKLCYNFLIKKGFTQTHVKTHQGQDIAYRYTNVATDEKVGIFSHGDSYHIIDKYYKLLQDCPIVICASRHSKPQFTAIREIIKKPKRTLHILYKTGKHKLDMEEDDNWVVEQFKEKIKKLPLFADL